MGKEQLDYADWVLLLYNKYETKATVKMHFERGQTFAISKPSIQATSQQSALRQNKQLLYNETFICNNILCIALRISFPGKYLCLTSFFCEWSTFLPPLFDAFLSLRHSNMKKQREVLGLFDPLFPPGHSLSNDFIFFFPSSMKW